MKFIIPSVLSKMILKGANRIIEGKNTIDSINVFPINDSDTGTNLASTFLPIKKTLTNNSFDKTNVLTDAVLKTAFASSRGNSGIMMASFLKGFLTPLKDKKNLSLVNLSKGAREGYKESKDSIGDPIKGTMLDTMEAFSLSLHQDLHDRHSGESRHQSGRLQNLSGQDVAAARDSGQARLASRAKRARMTAPLIDIFYEAAQKTKEALIATEEKLEILKTNHVVDAGALGFTLFVYGLYEGLSGVRLELSGIDTKLTHRNKATDVGKFPYEVVFTIQNPQFSTKELRTMISSLGNSLDILEIKKKIKIHIHTDKPEVVKETAELTGKVISMQIVDMRTIK